MKLAYVIRSYTMICPHVRGDNPRALASGLSPLQVDNHGTTILIPHTLNICVYLVYMKELFDHCKGGTSCMRN